MTGAYPVALFIECAAIIWAIVRRLRYRSGRLLTPSVILIAGTFFALFTVILSEKLAEKENELFENITMALFSAVRVFPMAYGLKDCFDLLEKEGPVTTCPAYPYFFIGIAMFAMLLTFEVVLSFFGDILNYPKLFIGTLFHDKYVFSELNEKSLALAESIRKRENKKSGRLLRMIIFTNVKKDCPGELLERARKIRSVRFKRDMTSINFKWRLPGHKLYLFAINRTESESIDMISELKTKYGKCRNTRLYVFSASLSAEILAMAGELPENKGGEKTKNQSNMEIRCVNEARSLIWNMLYERGVMLFRNAPEKHGERQISVIIAGLGNYGEEMLKALTWFCQMDGYYLTIHVFDKNSAVISRFQKKCTELLDAAHNGTRSSEEAQYEIVMHPGIDVETEDFRACLDASPVLADCTYAFVTMGEDDLNIRAAVSLRTAFKRKEKAPEIYAVVQNAGKARALEAYTSFQNESYCLHAFGDNPTLYSEKVIINSELEQAGLLVQMRYSKDEDRKKAEREYYFCSYNYFSSIASAIHQKGRDDIGFSGDSARMEHRRWNAYLRSEGYQYGPKKNFVGKLHPDLVPNAQLCVEEQDKDKRIVLIP